MQKAYLENAKITIDEIIDLLAQTICDTCYSEYIVILKLWIKLITLFVDWTDKLKRMHIFSFFLFFCQTTRQVKCHSSRENFLNKVIYFHAFDVVFYCPLLLEDWSLWPCFSWFDWKWRLFMEMSKHYKIQNQFWDIDLKVFRCL